MNQKIDFFLFGATGDLAARKIIPALFSAFLKGLISADFRLIATGRKKLDTKAFCSLFAQKDHERWPEFCRLVRYVSADVSDNESFSALTKKRRKASQAVVYFSISPEYFLACAKRLYEHGLVDAKLILEKPLGLNLEQNQAINAELLKHFKEEQIYRIDHYLGKPMVQQLLLLRRASAEFDAQLAAPNLLALELCAYERLGVENRGEFYDNCGAMRDMLQNHLLQMLALFAIDAHASDIRAAKTEFFNSLKRIDETDLRQNIQRAQYTAAGTSADYVAEPKVAANSRTETYVEIKTTATAGRLKDVEIYLKTGKRMSKDAVYLRAMLADGGQIELHIQPESKIIHRSREGGFNNEQVIELNVDNSASAYERLILEALAGALENFNSALELEAAWRWIQPAVDDQAYTLYKYPAFSLPQV